MTQMPFGAGEDLPDTDTDLDTDLGSGLDPVEGFEETDDVDEDLLDVEEFGAEEFGDTLAADAETGALWVGDQGNLEARQRDTLVALLKKSFISSDDAVAWRTLTQNPGPIVTSLNNLYFTLVVDEHAEVAFATPARNADNPFKTLVRDAANSREETLLLIYLRERHRAETASGQPTVYADVTAMLDYVARFRPVSATDVAGDERRVKNAIAGLVTSGLLVKTADADRFRVHRAIEALLPLPTLNQLVAAFRAHNAGTDTTSTDETSPDETGTDTTSTDTTSTDSTSTDSTSTDAGDGVAAQEKGEVA